MEFLVMLFAAWIAGRFIDAMATTVGIVILVCLVRHMFF